ncbi:MAG: radical SAM protein [Endomicrobiales bacterium]|nr:radical SAM protein [Endomicrobiales bacterium]
MKVALLQCPVWGTREPPLAVVQLSGCLKAQGIETRSFDVNNRLYKRREESYKNLWAWEQSMFWYSKDNVKRFFSDISGTVEGYADEILAFGPALAGFSVAASSYHFSVEMAKLLKRKDKNMKVCFGGQLFLDKRNIEKAFGESCVDYVIAHESDIALGELARALEKGNIANCAGIHRSDGTRVSFTGERKSLKNLDKIPYMDFSDLRIEDYDDSRHIMMMASRGCVWNCAFCSSRAFWPGYRYMSGERIHQEISYHRSLQKPDVSHIDFADLVFNGNIDRVREFAKLMVKYPPFPASHKMQWNANAIISPGLDEETLRLMAESGCQRLFFGIESGSQKVLNGMKKFYSPELALDVIRNASKYGIKVTCNFMFGFPGETEQDFDLTLDFVKQAAPYVERVYPSRTYCSLEESSYLHSHPEEYGIRTPLSHHLYWESNDGTNTYPVRLKRCQRFELLCREIGLKVDCGVKTTVELDEYFNLGHYHEFKKEYDSALSYYDSYRKLDPENEVVNRKIEEILKNMAGEAQR